MSTISTFSGGPIFDGKALHHGKAARFEDGILAEILLETDAGSDTVSLCGDILCPGCIDLQVNGGGGAMFNDTPSHETLERIAMAHLRLGTTHFLPTLITDTPAKTATAIEAVAEACATGLQGVAGLHLEGPHIAPSRHGAHDPSLIRPMEAEDLKLLCEAARRLPALMVTLAPESVTLDHVRHLADAGAIIALGHSDADYETSRAYFDAGARVVTHLFNAMSQLGHRAPGLVGAALADGRVSAGLIADGIHVHPDVMRMALAAKSGPGAIFLVSDAMAVAGTDQTAFQLNGRLVHREEGRLTLENGTLAGADLTLPGAIRTLTEIGIPLADALASATTLPAAIIGADIRWTPGRTRLSDVIRLRQDLLSAMPLAS